MLFVPRLERGALGPGCPLPEAPVCSIDPTSSTASSSSIASSSSSSSLLLHHHHPLFSSPLSPLVVSFNSSLSIDLVRPPQPRPAALLIRPPRLHHAFRRKGCPASSTSADRVARALGRAAFSSASRGPRRLPAPSIPSSATRRRCSIRSSLEAVPTSQLRREKDDTERETGQS
ncbi:hypothetical protein CDD83_2222 [Cordyceps sp. RAO-2017]|nr:hypothetical protein CDD83_2222 [Cordyceps sp. RAO-2017]